jgi:hypothetical protein
MPKANCHGVSDTFMAYGDIDEIEVGELQKMKTSAPRFLKEPWLIILDDDVVNYLGLDELYSRILKPEDLDNFFKLSADKIKERLSNAPSGVKGLVVSKARELVESGELDSMKRIEAIEETLDVTLRDND